MKNKNVTLAVAILASLVIASFSFYVTAQEKSNNINNVFIDSDQDGLTDEEERLYGTNPGVRDSDGDGYSDGAEVKSGYDPMKPAPGDRLVQDSEKAIVANVSTDENNLTRNVAVKIAQMTNKPSDDPEADGAEINLDQVKSLVDDSLNNAQKEEIPEISKDDLHIKNQDYKKLSDKEKEEKKKEDFASYITAVYYILSSNSPKPLTSASDITSVSAQISQQIMGAIDSRDPAALDDLNKSGQKIMEQMKEVEVPEELVDTHLKAIRFASYSQSLEKYINPVNEDPLQDIANYSKMAAYVQSLLSFADDAQEKFSKYGIKYDTDIKGKLKDMGINPLKDSALLDLLSE